MDAGIATVLAPRTADEVAQLVRASAVDGLGLDPRGGGTRARWRDRRGDRERATLSLAGLQSPIEHYPGDLVVTAAAGVTLRALNSALAAENQWLPLDPATADATTVGGLVATNDSGPRRHKYGAPRDLLLGIELVLADGRRVKGGGRVVKNVAGYDLPRLICGSWGSLAIITAATFKLMPCPAASCTVIVTRADAPRLAALALDVAAAPVAPTAIEVYGPPFELLVRFESTPRAVDQQADIVRQLCASQGGTVDIVSGDTELAAWERASAHVRTDRGALLSVNLLPTGGARVVEAVERAGAASDRDVRVTGRAADGVWLIRLQGGHATQLRGITALAEVASSCDGHVRVLEADDEIRDQLAPDRAPRAPAAALLAAVKARFDPHGLLPPPVLG